MKKIDTHQHLLYPDRLGYSWTENFPALQGSFSLADYQKAAEGCEIESTLFMEVDVDRGDEFSEARFFCEIAEDPAHGMAGVIARAYPEEEAFEQQLEQIQHTKLKGIRRVLHTQDDALSEGRQFRQNLSLLGRTGLSFDLCVRQDQLPLALDLVRVCPDTRFILDHCGVPDIAGHSSNESEGWKQWRRGIQALAREANLVCKFSGITAYASEGQRTVDGLRPYLHEILQAFGSDRIVWGGDWPVCQLGSGLLYWSQLTDCLLKELSAGEQEAILSRNAQRIYRL